MTARGRLFACALGVAAAACASKPPAPAAHAAPPEPHWQDALEVTPELLMVVHPKALQGDRVYGPLLKHAIRAARDQSKVVEAMHPLDTLEDAEEVVIGVRPDAPEHPGELVMAARGLRADVDPGRLVDDDGQPIWTAGPQGATRELVHEQDGHGHPVDASLFELPGRTWVVASGPARARAREVFAHPFARPRSTFDLAPGALASVRIDGPSLVAHIGALQDGGAFGIVGRRLRALTFELPPGGEGAVKGVLAYADEDAAAFSEVTLRDAAAAIARSSARSSAGGGAGLAWLGRAKVERLDRRVIITAPLPPSLLEGLLGAGAAPLGSDPPSATPPTPRRGE